MPTSRFARRLTPIKPPGICRAPPKPPLGPIPWPPAVILCAAQITYTGGLWDHYQIGGLIRCERSPATTTYTGHITRGGYRLDALIEIALDPPTAAVHLTTTRPTGAGADAHSDLEPFDFTKPINLVVQPWAYNHPGTTAQAHIAT